MVSGSGGTAAVMNSSSSSSSSGNVAVAVATRLLRQRRANNPEKNSHDSPPSRLFQFQPQQQQQQQQPPTLLPPSPSKEKKNRPNSSDRPLVATPPAVDAAIELPNDLWTSIVADYLHNDLAVGGSVQALSETCRSLNRTCALYLQSQLVFSVDFAAAAAAASRFSRSALVLQQQQQTKEPQNYNSKIISFTMPPRTTTITTILTQEMSVFCRLARQNPSAAADLLAHYRASSGLLPTSSTTNEKAVTITERSHTTIHVPICVVVSSEQQQDRVLFATRFRRQFLSDDFAARLEAQRDRALFWTRTAMGCLLVSVLLIGTTATTTTTTTSSSSTTEALSSTNTMHEKCLNSPFLLASSCPSVFRAEEENEEHTRWIAMRWLIGALFSATVAIGVAQQQKQRRRKQQQQHKQQVSLTQAAPVATSASSSTNAAAAMKRSQSMAEDLMAMSRRSLECAGLDYNNNRKEYGAAPSKNDSFGRGRSLHESLSSPNFQQFLELEEEDSRNTTVLLSGGRPKELVVDHPQKSYESLWVQSDNDVSPSDASVVDSLQSIAVPCLFSTNSPTESSLPIVQTPERNPGRGCVGSFSGILAQAQLQVVDYILEQRQKIFLDMNLSDRAQFASAFLDVCASDSTIDLVRTMSHSLPISDFYLGADGTESCALHTAAFHGATQVLDFLCHGIDESERVWNADGGATRDDENNLQYYNDGGLCNVNATDANGWTALHFAASAGNINVVRLLVMQHGADPHVQAVNGYTPLQWAVRLQKHAVAAELRRCEAVTDAVNRSKKMRAKGRFWKSSLCHCRQHFGSIALVVVLLALPNFAVLIHAHFSS